MLPKTLLITFFINEARLVLTVINNFLLKLKNAVKENRIAVLLYNAND